MRKLVDPDLLTILFVIPAKGGIHGHRVVFMHPGLRRGDGAIVAFSGVGPQAGAELATTAFGCVTLPIS
jgi:hypothetical protein